MDWSDHAMWWPEKNIWLDKTRWTLDQYNLTADAVVHFTPMHKTIRIQLPDLRYVDLTVDFSVRTFNAVINLCKELGKYIIMIKIRFANQIKSLTEYWRGKYNNCNILFRNSTSRRAFVV